MTKFWVATLAIVTVGCTVATNPAPAPAPAGTGDTRTADPACTNCPGCCAGGTCVALSQQDATTCGASGVACAACDATSKCDKGACVVDPSICSPASCKDGCCSGNTCVQAASQSPTSCGSAGGACAPCAAGIACTSGKCDPTHWSSTAADIFTLTPVQLDNCTCTDAVGLPDPFVTITSSKGPVSTNHCADSVGCAFTAGSIEVSAAELIAGVAFTVSDEDVSVDDLCGSGKIKLDSPIPVQDTYQVTAQSQKFTFKLAPKQ